MTPHTTLISCEELEPHLGDAEWAVFDCRFDLQAPARGREEYLKGHIARAVHADLDRDLTGPIEAGVTGRHPLPPVDAFVATLSRWGVDDTVQVVAYDDQGGTMAAARLWWMLRWLGHDTVAVLDGGWSAWKSRGGPVATGTDSRLPRRFAPRIRSDMVVNGRRVDELRSDPSFVVCDSRGPDRYRGENETIDPVAGHIPGALSVPYRENLDAAGGFLTTSDMKRRFERVMPDARSKRVVFYCGSGVTAAHNVLAFRHAGLGDALLYPGSWSEWITDARRPIATGPNPD
jgi:thiosulfate/3-mercaptopyruvate sulfurtransferase